jgi:nitrogen fixation protein FixH
MDKDIKSSFIPYLFVLFTLGYIFIDLAFIYFSKQSYSGIVTDNAYQKGLDYNRVLELNEKQQQLGWQVDLDIKKGIKGEEFKVILLDKGGKTISDAFVSLKIINPVRDQDDIEIRLKEQSKGIYEGIIENYIKGQREVKLSINKGNDRFFLRNRLIFGVS